MTRRAIIHTAAGCVVAFMAVAPAKAQEVGVRAAGMGGAFTGVADDASAVYWNPAGLASGGYFSGVVDVESLKTASDSPALHTSSGGLVAIAMPPLGLSYYRTRTTTPSGFLLTQNAGATVDQSLWAGVTAGATVRLVHGVTETDFSSTKVDMDVGVMEAGSIGRIGLTVHNLLRPEFAFGPGSPDGIRADRQVRVGGSIDVTASTLLAADADLTSAALTGADRREAAIGVEQRLSAKAVVRGGFHWNTRFRTHTTPADNLGLAPEGSVGASYAVYGRTSADAQVTFGSPNGDRGWGVGLRVIF